MSQKAERQREFESDTEKELVSSIKTGPASRSEARKREVRMKIWYVTFNDST